MKNHKKQAGYNRLLKKILFKMKLTLTIFLFCIAGVSASTYSQSTRLDISIKNSTMVELINQIEEKSEFFFYYQKEELRGLNDITLELKNATISEILDEVLEDTGIDYSVIDRYIVLRTDGGSFGENFLASARKMTNSQQRAVSGKVTDINNQPLPGVTVIIKGTTQGTVTNPDGEYNLTNIPEGATLVFSYVGLESQEIVVGTQSVINVSLEESTIGLGEVVAIGYGTKRRADITGSVAVVNTENLQSVKSFSAAQALQGMAAGVNITPSGVPGNSPRINIRGISSFGDASPLIIVDGIQQNLNNISANDIESIQVLKDAGAASIYGVRGANGVILVTTKKGKTGEPTISYEGTYGVTFPLPGDPWNILNSEEYMTVYNRAFPGNPRFANGMPDYMYRGPQGAGVAFAGDPKVDPSLYFYESPNKGKNYLIQEINKEGTDWFHALFKRAPTTEHNVTASGGTNKSKYLFALGYLHQQGTLLNTDLKRYSARVNTEFTIGKNLRIGENANILHRNNQGFGENSQFGGIVETVKQQPIVPLYDIMGNYGGTFGGPELGDGQNPVAAQDRNVARDVPYDWYIIGNAYAELDFLKDFTARTSIGYNISNDYTLNFSTTQVENVQANTSPNSLSVTAGYGSTMTFTNTLNYQKTFGVHNLEVLIGSEAIKYASGSVNGSRTTFFSEAKTYLTLAGGTEAVNNSSSVGEETLFSLFGRLDYSFNDKYLLGATLRRDGSSRFGPDSRYGVFPAFSAAWRISQESFMNISWLDDLKIRASYGILGSQNNVSAANSFNLYGASVTGSYYDIMASGTGEVQGFYVSRIGNLATSWEENIVTNIGFDATMFDNKLDFSLEYYKKSIAGLLFSEQLPAVIIAGSTAPTVNIGDIQNSGFDGSIEYRGNVADFKYSVGLNVTNYKNEVVDVPDPGYFGSGSWQGVGTPVRNEEGHPVSSFYGYNVIGLFNSDEEVASAPTQDAAAPGRFRYEDVDGDNKITIEDRVHLGDPNPDFTGGLNITMAYKNFDLYTFFYGSVGNKIANLNRSYLYFMSFYPTTNKSRELLNAWTPDNKNTNIPRLETAGTFSSSGTMNSFYVEDGSFLKLKTLQLGYTIDPQLLKRINISKVRLSATLANLFTLTKYTGLDPEFIGGSSSVFGVDLGSYPNNELNLIFGLSIAF